VATGGSAEQPCVERCRPLEVVDMLGDLMQDHVPTSRGASTGTSPPSDDRSLM
jgi:hypothetical protein